MHDAQIGVTGDAAAKLGELFRAQWVRATEEPLPAPEGPRAQIDLAGAKLDNHAVGVSRTSTDLDGAEVREVQALTLLAIASAQRYIMIENQYLSSALVGDALAERLRNPDGPEVLVILPRAESGWLEQESMGLLKQRLLRKLRHDEKGGRLRVLYPATAGVLEGGDIYVHSKILLIDDEFAKIGSSNLSNRACLFFPLSVSIAAVCVAAPGWRAFVILYGGALASSLATYWIGRSVKVPLPSRLNRKALQLQHKLKKGGFLAVLLARLVPVGSFTLINGVAGMLKIPFPAYTLANAVGLIPGILLLLMLSGRLAALWTTCMAA